MRIKKKHLLLWSLCLFYLFGGQYVSAGETALSQQKLLRILFAGDTSFGENYQEKLEEKGKINILKEKGHDYSMQGLAGLLSKSDLVIINLETPLTDMKSSPLKDKKKYLHWGDPAQVPLVLKRYNVQAVSLANNHALDFGVRGLRQTIDALHSNDIFWFGAEFNADKASRSFSRRFMVDKNTFHIKVVGGYWFRERYANEYSFYADEEKAGVNAWTEEASVNQIRELRRSDPNAFIVAFPHWGRNYKWKSNEQTRLGQAMVEAGADIVIGHGAHMMQEIERYNCRWIIYNLGNFVFNSPGRYQKNDEGSVHPFSTALRLDVDKENNTLKLSLQLYPIFSDNRVVNYQPRLVTSKEMDRLSSNLLDHSRKSQNLQSHLLVKKDEVGLFFRLDIGTLTSSDTSKGKLWNTTHMCK